MILCGFLHPIRKVGLSEKLLKRYFGPYKVTKKLSEVTYEVEPVDPSPRSREAKDIVHVIRMKPYLDPEEQHSILLGNTSRDRFFLEQGLRQANQRVAVFSKEGVMSKSIQMGHLSIIPGPRGDHRCEGFSEAELKMRKTGRWLTPFILGLSFSWVVVATMYRVGSGVELGLHTRTRHVGRHQRDGERAS
ncbi:hypothetical protein LAZ67_8002143 [Cordylochernes scorpioides]|uniref:Integrase p58-like C-terminal domain-containing protein n=1 Tax=Cordylochernes scorpioides TaxID=51811 RepID=A0ABY6KRG3_9ARAC|nr:hypothetical protein LAZ67_8002143 [Cordylochernes scorpioides]